MKNFTRTINGVKYKGEMFEELDIINKFNLSNEKWELIDKYQKTFPQLLLKDTNDFIIDGETLWNELGKPQGEYGKWFKRKVECLFQENVDYSRFAKLVGTIKNNKGKEVIRHTLTLESSKHICLMSGSDKKSDENVREKGNLIREYFMLMEKTLKKYNEWTLVREPEKEGFKEMRKSISDWCIRNHYDPTDEYFYIRESNMLNVALTGLKACDLRAITKAKFNQTRDNLFTEVNQILSNLQFANIVMLENNSSFIERQKMIENMCSSKYKHIKEYYIL